MHTPASAYLASSSSSSAVPATSALVQFSRATSSVLYQGFKNEIKDDSSCQVAQDLPPDFWQSSAVPVDASSLVKDGIRSKTLLSPPIALNVSNPALECVQCVEVLHTDTMNHVVPELDDMGREIDVIWQPTDLVCPSKGKRDGRQTRRPDYGPEGDFEELCWEDGQLFVVMQGLNNKGNLNKRSCWQMSAGEMTAPHLELPTGGSMDTTFDTLGTEDLMDLPTINMQTEEDDLLTWLQQAPEELADKCEIVSDTTIANGQDCERLYQSDLTNPGIKCSCVNPEGVEVGEVSKACRNDTGVALPMKAVHHEDTSQKVPSSISIPSTTITCKDPYVPCLGTAKLGIPSPLMHSVTVTQSTTVHIPCYQSLPTGSTTAMNFGNFSRPAASIKANLQSLCMASGPSGPERLKQLDRVAVDASKSICSRTKSLRLIAPRREESILPSVMGSVGASTVCIATQTYPLDREAEQAMPAVGGFNGCSGVGGQSDGWNSSIISSTAVGTERSTEVLGAMEHSDTSSGESEDSEGIRRKRAPDKGKRGFCDKDSEIRSKALERKSHTMVVESLKRSRAAENHNQSERRRRDRISEKMKILQSLVPNAHKTDKASMLEEAIAYIKALKAQIQMMSYISGSYFTPMHMPHVQMAPPWPQMSMGLGMNMERGMFNMTKFSPMFQFPGAVFPTIHATAAVAPNSFHPAHVMANHGIPHSAHNSANQMLLPVGSGSTVNVTSFKTYPASQQERLVQCTNPGVVRAGTFGNGKAHAPQSVPLSTCMAGLRSVQQK